MPDESKNVEYSFTGNVTSLRSAATTAISLLSKYSQAEQAVGKQGAFTVAERSARKLQNTFVGVNKQLQTMQSKLKAVTTTGPIGNAVAMHEKFKTTLQGLTQSMTTETEAVDKEKEKLKSKNKTLKESATSHENLKKSVDKTEQSVVKETKTLQIATTALSSMKNALKGVLATFTGIKLGEWFASAAKNSIAYIESLNLFQVAMGSSIDKGMQFVDQMQEIYGMDPKNLYNTAGYFYQMTDAIGMTDEASASIALSLTSAANNIASLFNVDIQTVVDNLASGMQGMSRAVRKYGMDIRATTLQQTALQYGLTEQVETMSEANRMALRYITMMEQATNALNQTTKSLDGTDTVLGDFARNIETPANQLRVFKEQMSQLGRAIGNFIVAPLSKALPYINGFIMALRTLINFVGSALGLISDVTTSVSTDNTDAMADSVAGIGSAASSAADKLQQMVAPFDELNILQEQTDTGGGGGGMGMSDTLDPALAKALADMEARLDNIRMKANDVRDAILEFLGFKVENGDILGWDPSKLMDNLMNLLPKSVRSALQPTLDALSDLFNTIGDSLLSIYEESVSPLVGKLSESFNLIWGTLESLGGNILVIIESIIRGFDTLWSTSIDPFIRSFLEGIGQVIDIFNILWEGTIGPILEFVGDRFQSLWTQSLQPIFENLLQLLFGLGELVLNLWNVILAPLVEYLATVFGPIFVGVFKGIWTVFEFFVSIIATGVNLVLDVLNGLIQMINGVLTADWTRALTGWINIFIGVMNAIIGALEACINFCLGAIDTFINAVIEGFKKVFDVIGSVGEAIAAVFGIELDLTLDWGSVSVGRVTLGRIPEVALANGGVVNSPTEALIGEGRYSEAVIPLENSPQMLDLIDKIADKVNSVSQAAPQSEPVMVKVYIGGKEFDSQVYKAYQRAERSRGAAIFGGVLNAQA